MGRANILKMKKRYYVQNINGTYAVRIDSHDNRKRCMYFVTIKTFGASRKAEAYKLADRLNSQLDQFTDDANYQRRWSNSSHIHLIV